MRNLILSIVESDNLKSLIIDDVVTSLNEASKGLVALQYVADLEHDLNDNNEWHAEVTEKLTDARNTLDELISKFR